MARLLPLLATHTVYKIRVSLTCVHCQGMCLLLNVSNFQCFTNFYKPYIILQIYYVKETLSLKIPGLIRSVSRDFKGPFLACVGTGLARAVKKPLIVFNFSL
jgi:hypothetical protein